MSDKKISVIIPTYSRPKYLKRCINSILNQTYKNIEIIVVDDNNPDSLFRNETERIMNKYKHVKNIIYLKHEKNKNGSAARNTGWRFSSGDYITFIDDDDEIMQTKLEEQINCLESLDKSWGACYTGYLLIKENGEKQYSSERRQGNCYIDALMRTMFMGSGSNLMIRKEIVDEIGGYDESFLRNQDIEFLVRVLKKYKLAYIDKFLLIIHQEGYREKRTFSQIDNYTRHYLNKFENDINKLNTDDKERVLSVITLERCRVALYKKKYKQIFLLIKENKIKIKYIFKYIIYLCHRCLTHKSYGFRG